MHLFLTGVGSAVTFAYMGEATGILERQDRRSETFPKLETFPNVESSPIYRPLVSELGCRPVVISPTQAAR
jgi:hypothetical protein